MVKSGFKKTEIGLIPLDWDIHRLAELVDFLDGQRRPVKSADRAKMSGPIPYYGASGIVDYVNDFLFDEDLIFLGEDGENILSRNQPLAFCISGKAWVNNHAHVLRPRQSTVIGYLAEYLESLNYEHLNSGTAQPKLNKKTCLAIPVALPPTRAEQEAIAGVLSNADALIESLDALIAKKRQIKQGAMQELLTGNTRLPGFSDEWDDLLVEDVIERFFCGPSPTCEERNVTGAPEWGVLKTTAITWECGWDWTKHKTLPERYWEQSALEVKVGDVIVTKAGPRHRVGVVAWVDSVPERLIVSGKMICLRSKPSRAVALMLSAAIASRETQWFLDQRTTGMAESQVNFQNGDLLRAPIRLPAVEEQTAIAAILSDMDAEIAALKTKLAKARQIKQGMMQELLTGRIRLI
jgi:type I restriction enzyme S subunit